MYKSVVMLCGVDVKWGVMLVEEVVMEVVLERVVGGILLGFEVDVE